MGVFATPTAILLTTARQRWVTDNVAAKCSRTAPKSSWWEKLDLCLLQCRPPHLCLQPRRLFQSVPRPRPPFQLQLPLFLLQHHRDLSLSQSPSPSPSLSPIPSCYVHCYTRTEQRGFGCGLCQ